MAPEIVYSSPVIPAEWIAAHNLRPVRIGPCSPEPLRIDAPMGACRYAAMMRHHAEGAGGIVLASTCDQMRRAAELLPGNAFLLNIPATWGSPTALRIFEDELRRLGDWLVSLGGAAPDATRLARTMLRYDALRRELRCRAGRLCSRAYAETLAQFGTGGELRAFEPSAIEARTPLAVVGGPMCHADLRLLDVIEAAGGRVVLDATETGERGLLGPFDRRLLHDDPFGELARTCFDSIPDAFRRPSRRLETWLLDQFDRRGVRGVVVVRRVWCDLWHAQVARLRELTPLPLIEIDLDHGEGDLQRNRTRIEALLEVSA